MCFILATDEKEIANVLVMIVHYGCTLTSMTVTKNVTSHVKRLMAMLLEFHIT